MPVHHLQKFSFSFQFEARKFEARAEMFQVHRYPQVYVAAQMGNQEKGPDIFTFYKVDQPGKMLLWFKHTAPWKEDIAKVIAKALENHFSK